MAIYQKDSYNGLMSETEEVVDPATEAGEDEGIGHWLRPLNLGDALGFWVNIFRGPIRKKEVSMDSPPILPNGQTSSPPTDIFPY